MISNVDKRCLFFGFEVEAPWPVQLPTGCIVYPCMRHLTLVFLGRISYQKVQNFLSRMPKPSFLIGQVGIFDSCLFLPAQNPRVVAYHMQPLGLNLLSDYQKELISFLQEEGCFLEKRNFLPHVTLARSPFLKVDWQKHFSCLPMYCASLHLYESLGYSRYQSLWSYPLHDPFIEVAHTADMAFLIYGESPKQIHLHAQIAMSFECPALLAYMQVEELQDQIESIINQLNTMVSKTDRDVGIPLKAVSFHGDIHRNKNGLLEWEMIIDI